MVLGVSGWIPRKEHEKPRDCSSPMPSCPQNTGPQRPPLPGWAFLTGMEVWTPICPRCPAPAPDQDRRRPLGEGRRARTPPFSNPLRPDGLAFSHRPVSLTSCCALTVWTPSDGRSKKDQPGKSCPPPPGAKPGSH